MTTKGADMIDYGKQTAWNLPAEDPYSEFAIQHHDGRVVVAPDGSRWTVARVDVAPLVRAGWKRGQS